MLYNQKKQGKENTEQNLSVQTDDIFLMDHVQGAEYQKNDPSKGHTLKHTEDPEQFGFHDTSPLIQIRYQTRENQLENRDRRPSEKQGID
jgi:hypothetical protein